MEKHKKWRGPNHFARMFFSSSEPRRGINMMEQEDEDETMLTGSVETNMPNETEMKEVNTVKRDK